MNIYVFKVRILNIWRPTNDGYVACFLLAMWQFYIYYKVNGF